jgi:SAM-dependent methyltransferase
MPNKSSPDHTKICYQNPEFVSAYTNEHVVSPHLQDEATEFAQSIPGKRILDLGCGPGQYARLFAEIGYNVTGLDYSEEMIKIAQSFCDQSQNPTFRVGDIRRISEYFAPNSFDGIWACASILHISPKEIDDVLRQLTNITVGGGKIFFGWVGGEHLREGTQIEQDNNYGISVTRTFTYWNKITFQQKLNKHYMKVDEILETEKWFHIIATNTSPH